MRDTGLILIEGLTGSGKSTTAQRLWLHLEGCGHATEWVYEHDTAHPVWPAGERERIVAGAGLDPAYAAETLPQRWRDLAARCAAQSCTTIVDGALLQSTIGLLLAMRVDSSHIMSSVMRCGRAAAASKPVLVWLRPRDVARSLRASFEDRRDSGYEAALVALLAATPWGREQGLADFAGLVRFYESWRELAESLLHRLGMAVVVVDADDWPARERQISDFLGVPPIGTPGMRVDAPARFLGHYRDAASDDRLVIAGSEAGLYLDDARRTSLIPRSGGRFHIASMCAEVEFDDERDGRFQGLVLRGPLPDLSPRWQRVDGAAEEGH